MYRTKVEAFCDKLIEAGWLSALVVVPLFFNVYSSRVFEPDKITLLRSIAVLMAAAWVVKLIERGLGEVTGEASVGGAATRLWQQVCRTPMVLPTLVLVGVYVLSTMLSVVPRVSLLGSYQRLQGTYSTLSYVVVFVLMLQGLRTREQVERLITTVVLTSLPIALYGIVQHYGLDPLPWGGDVRTRVAGNMGNAIFIAAYMIMALPLALYRVVESFTRILTSDESRSVDIFLGAAYVFVLAVQAICIVFTQSRGPWLGLVGGAFFFFLVYAVVHRQRWLVWVLVLGVVGFAGFLIVFNLPNTPLEDLKSAAYVGRLGRVLDKEEGTSKVRLLIWEGAIDMILPHPPLERPDGSRDWLNFARTAFGYGPESMYVAYNRFYPPDLAHYEARNASPDRSHNETFDALVITGVVGFAAYMYVFASVFYYGFRWLGVIVGPGQRRFYIACWVGGGIVGAATMVLWQGPEFFGVGLPAGIAAGLGLYLGVWGLFLSQHVDRDAAAAREANPYVLLLVALVAGILGHFVEIHFGIAIAATRTYFWAYTGLLVVVGHVLPRALASEQAWIAEQPVAGGTRSKGRRSGRRTRRQPSTRALIPPGVWALLPYALVLTLILATLAFDFVSSNEQALSTPGEIVSASLTRRIANGEAVRSYGVLGVVGITWLLGSAISVAEWHQRAKRSEWPAALGVCLAISCVLSYLFALTIAARLLNTVRQTQVLGQARMVMGMLTNYYVLAFLLLLFAGLALLREAGSTPAFSRRGRWWTYPIMLGGAIAIAVVTNLRVVHADMVYKQAQPYERQGLWDISVVLHQEAIRLAPHEDYYHLFLGRAFLEKAKSARAGVQPAREYTMAEVLSLTPQELDALSREELMSCSEAALQRAREINPLNTDHSANLGRLFRTRAEVTSDPAQRYDRFQQALAYYAQATSLSPNAAHLYNEWGLVYLSMGEQERAIAKYEYALALDDRYEVTYMSLGDAYMRANDLDKAKEMYLEAVALKPGSADVHGVLAYIYGMQGDYGAAVEHTLEVLARSNDSTQRYTSYKNLAIYYEKLSQPERALSAAEEALALAPEGERASLQAWIAQVLAGGAGGEAESRIQELLSSGQIALNGGRWDEAALAYETALALNPELVAAHSALAYIYAQQGKLEQAEAENLLVLGAIPDDLSTLKNLAIIYRQLQRYDEALAYAQRAMSSSEVTAEDKRQLEVFIGELQQLRSPG
ncbi:MAG: tetratricopeptide repeat protein [Anaerolineae bacterium]|nr:tetratricopeptide repeat protein [Anaerolineae bacterium]